MFMRSPWRIPLFPPAARILPRRWGIGKRGQQDFDFSKRPICQAFGWRRPHRFAVQRSTGDLRTPPLWAHPIGGRPACRS